MFDFAWSEIMLIGAVALIAIGPKDMPAAIRTVTGMIKKARRMAAEFQTHVDEMVREAELGDVKSAFNDLRRMDITSALEKAVDPDRSIRRTFEENPLDHPAPAPAATEVSTLDPATITTPEDAEPVTGTGDTLAETLAQTTAETSVEGAPAAAEPEPPHAPAFIPPQLVPKPETRAAAAEPPASAPPAFIPPAFIPTRAVLQRQPEP